MLSHMLSHTLPRTFGIALLGGLMGCGPIAIATAPSKKAVLDDSGATKDAQLYFWTTLHQGGYDHIGAALDKLQAAYLGHPEDPRTAAHIAFLHIWRFSERARRADLTATVTDDMMLAHRYFEEAVKLDPGESRFRGFLAATTMAEGAIHHDEKLSRRGFFEMKDAVAAWPEFNLFTRGYSMSRLPVDNPRFAAALEDQWDTLDKCTDSVATRVDRKRADFSPYMHLETQKGPKRACWNSWIAPHNFEGFFLNMGDMLVKAGDPSTARKIYAQARLAKDFPTWPYREVLERRITEADQNISRFRAAGNTADAEHHTMIDTPFACTACHQQ